MKAKAQSNSAACVILAAGKGTRMRSALPKVMHAIAHKPMLMHVIDTAKSLGNAKTVLVTAPDMQPVRNAVEVRYKGEVANAIQKQALGTGNAVQAAQDALQDFTGTVFILYGDTPLIRPEALLAMQKSLDASPQTALVVLGMKVTSPNAYGRLVMDKDGNLDRIVEVQDATPAEKAISLCNSGVMAVRGDLLFALLARITNHNAKGEYYLTDLVALVRGEGRQCRVVLAHASELMGVNSRAELAVAEAILQQRLRHNAMEHGATLLDPASVYFAHDTVLGKDVVIHPHVVFGPGVKVADNVEIRSFCHIEGAQIAPHATVGPFARLRPGAVICESAHIGNFVEIKKTTVERGAKVNHLSYIGDAQIGEGANVGAGTITCNYDGYAKHRTVIGAGAFIGSNSALVAPVVIGDGAIVGAGSVITEDVEEHALAIARSPQKQKKQWAKAFQRKKSH
jgi:bifunctional UDP-N-acetylglucosamine pyrophosphorylase/glucosamine-1-phosphate N-acetyltransferase